MVVVQFDDVVMLQDLLYQWVVIDQVVVVVLQVFDDVVFVEVENLCMFVIEQCIVDDDIVGCILFDVKVCFVDEILVQ